MCVLLLFFILLFSVSLVFGQISHATRFIYMLSTYDHLPWHYRTMQTAVGVFGGEGYTDRIDSLPLMVANAGNSGRPAISSLDCPPIIAVELCREHFVGLDICFLFSYYI